MVLHSDGRDSYRDVLDKLDGASMSYKIVRFFQDGRNRRTIKTGLTLEEAQSHCEREESCEREDAAGEGWFDGYTEDNK
jgi:hypothetical protein